MSVTAFDQELAGRARAPRDRHRGARRSWLRGFVVGLAVALLGALMPTALHAQAGATGQVTQFTITQPDPETPIRTCRDFYPIQFTHNGASGSYFISTDGADIEGSTFDGGPSQTQQEVAAGFDQDGPHTINLVLFQTRFNITFQTTQPAQINYDSTPPEFTVDRILLEADGAPIQYSAGQLIYTSNAQLGVQGTVTDPNDGSPSEEIEFTADVDGEESTFTGAEGGQYDGQVNLGSVDGEKVVRLSATDAFPDDSACTVGNKSEALQIRVVLDTEPAAVTEVVIIRNPQSATDREELPAGPRTFVGRDQVDIRVTFSEPLREQPVLTVTQNNGSAIRATPQQAQAIENRIFTWSYTPVPQDDQNGPAEVVISAILDRAGNETTGDPRQTISPAFKVDTIPPSRIRFPTPTPGDVVSVPADNATVGRDDFPQTIKVFVNDYDTRDATLDTTENASGVLFEAIERGEPGATVNSRALSITLISPDEEVTGTPSIAPPNGVFMTLPDFTNPDLGLNGFSDEDGDGIAEPRQGTWRIRVGLIDEVGNTQTEEFLFTVDTTPIRATDLIVTVTDPDANPNPLVLGQVSCLGGPDLQSMTASPVASVSSQDGTFSTTRSDIQWWSRIGGPNSAPVRFDTSTPDRSDAGISITDFREPGQSAATDDFPVPFDQPGEFLPPGSLDPRLGAADGIYLVRVIPEDDAGNRGVIVNGRRRDHVDYEVNLDTVTPYTRRTFPEGNTAINEPLRFVDAIVVDPESPANGNEGCGIDLEASNLQWFIEDPYRPDDVDDDLVASDNRMRTVLRFIHMPNNTDPTLPSFNPNDDAYRVLLELVDQNGYVRSLPTDGSMDGIYRILSSPTDNAGNTLGNGGPRGEYFGLAASDTTTLDLTYFYFLYDTVDPELTLDEFPEGSFIGGSSFTLAGDTLDLSARDQADQGGSGIRQVEVKLEVVDKNGNPIPDVAATPSATNPAVILPARKNPVIATSLAELAPLSDEANDPTLTTSNATGFGSTQRERRRWDFAGELPSKDRLLEPRTDTEGDYYRLSITSLDRAGNRTTITRRVVVSLDHLRPPGLRDPACGSYLNRPVYTFEWFPVNGATRYVFELTDPRGAVVRRPVTGTQVIQTLLHEGQYTWRVASVDAAGNQGSYSNPCHFILDRVVPSVLSVTHHDPVEPNYNQGTLGLGQAIFTVRFSEDLDTDHPISVKLDPKGAVGQGPLEVTTSSFEGDTWQGQVTIPPDADPTDWDGLANLHISGATDFAGNVQELDRNRSVEIDTGPYYATRFFVSPMTDREITVSILASENLIEPPSLLDVQGADLIDFSGSGARPRANPVAGDPRQSFVTLRIRSETATSPTVSFDLSGQDEDRNSSRRRVSFQVIRPSRSGADGGSTSALTASGMAIRVAAGASEGRNVFVFPPTARAGSPESLRAISQALVAEAGDGAEPSDAELEDLGFTETLKSSGDLRGKVQVALRAPEPAPGESYPRRQVGLYQLVSGRWTWIGGSDDEGVVRGTLRSFSAMKLARDAVAPRLEAATDPGALRSGAPGLVRWRVVEDGSGVDAGSIQVTLDGVPVPHRFEVASGEVLVDVGRELTPGTHELSMALTDRAGNAVRAVPMAVTGSGSFGFSDPPVAVPNPARGWTSIRFDLTQHLITENVTCQIYDSVGRRVRNLSFRGALAARDNRIDWDLRDGRGRTVRNGVYLFRIRARGQGKTVTRQGRIAVLN